MGPKSRKSVTLWQSCENCSSIVSSKDLEQHSDECSLPAASRTHCFIQDKTLFARVEEIKTNDIDEHIRSYRHELIFISESAMQLCNFVIGDPVVICTKKRKIVKKAWPKNEGSLTAVKISLGSPDFDDSIYKERVTLCNFKKCPAPATEVHFKLKCQVPDFDSFLKVLNCKYKYCIYNVGSIVSVPFYGQTVKIELIKFTVKSTDEESLNLDALSLDDNFYLIVESTVWTRVNKDTSVEDVNKISWDNIGGYKTMINELRQNINHSLTSISTLKSGGSQKFSGILLYGCHGTGKSLIAEAAANESGVNVLKAQASDFTCERSSGEGVRKLKELFDRAASSEPCIVVIDNMDSVAPATVEGDNRRMLAALTSGFDSLKHRRVVLIATAVSPQDIHPSLRRPARLEDEIEIGVPTEEDRRDILCKLVGDVGLSGAVAEVAGVTHGYVGADLSAVLAQARHRAASADSSPLSPQHLAWAVSRVTPSAMKQAQLHINKVKWEDIGGQEELKLKLRQAVEWPLLHPETFSRLGITPPRGILMFGPPGCSKTMIAKAIATETNLNFLSVKGSDIFSKWVGESERSVQELFVRARRVAPCVVFLDEVDAICSSRDSSGSGGGGSAVQERVLSQLLTEMDGVQPLTDVIIIAATNRPDRIDKAFLRPGRLDRLIYVSLPDFETRLQIFKVKTRRTPLSPCVDLTTLAENTQGYSGAEVAAVCNEAAMKALEQDLSSTQVQMNHFIEALKSVTPRTPLSLLKIYEQYINKTDFK